MSSRSDFLKRLKTLAEERISEREGESTFVKRGAVNWNTFNWESYSRGLAIMMDDSSLWPGVQGFREGNLTFEYFAKMPDQEGTPEIDDDLQDELIEDVLYIASQIVNETNRSGQPIVTRTDRKAARIIEAHDVDLKVQGVVVTINLNF